jgi:hypothetical protein
MEIVSLKFYEKIYKIQLDNSPNREVKINVFIYPGAYTIFVIQIKILFKKLAICNFLRWIRYCKIYKMQLDLFQISLGTSILKLNLKHFPTHPPIL